MPPEDRIETLRERIDAAEDISDGDADVLAAFDRQLNLRGTTISGHRHEKLLRHLVITAEEVGGVAAALEDREAAEVIVEWINDTYDHEETNRDYRVALRVFGSEVGEVEPGDDYPKSLEWVPSGTSSNHDPSPDPRNMLHWEEDVVPMIEAAFNSRDAAMIALQFDAGLRGGEFKSLSVGDVQDHDHGLQVTVEGKVGRRTVTLIPSVPYVNRWLADHPGADDDPLWSKLNTAESISDNMVYKALRECASRAGVENPVTPTNFRKSSAAFLASRNLNQAHIEDHHGWVRGSRVASRYVSVFAKDSDRELARVHGVDVEAEEPPSIAPNNCPRCGDPAPTTETFCLSCNHALDLEAKKLLEKVTNELDERAVEADDPEVRRSSVDARQGIESNPGTFSKEELHELVSSLEN